MCHCLVPARGRALHGLPSSAPAETFTGYWFWGRPAIYQLWDDLADLLRRIKPDFDPTTPEARASYAAAHNGAKKRTRKRVAA